MRNIPTVKRFNCIPDIRKLRWPCPEWFHVPTYDDCLSIPYNKHFEDFKLPPNTAYIRNNWTFYLATDRWYQSYLSSTLWNQDTFGTWYADRNNEILVNTQSWPDSFELNEARPIRPFKDIPVIPDDSWINNNWAYHNPTLWLISWIGRDNKWHTMADKNLWATEVWELIWPNYYCENRPTPTQANIWNLYQRWNNHWFPFGQNPTKTSTEKVDVSWYWPWEYTSDVFIITPNYWDSRMLEDNPDLRWWISRNCWK